MIISSVLSTTLILAFIKQMEAMDDASNNSSPDAVAILAVSTVLGQENSQPTGSLYGGTTLYMKVQGLDQTASNNAVYIGKYPCVISDKGVNGLFMNCKTTKPDLNDENLSGLSIVVRVAGKPDSICSFNKDQCHFTYSEDYTPILKFVTPRSNYPQQYSMWRAKWTVSSNTPIFLDGQFMGTNRCDRFNIKNKYPESIDSNDDFVACQVSAEIEAGYYKYTINSRNGYQKNQQGLTSKKVSNDETYDSKIAPLITSINSNFASPQGKILTINGYGFSTTLSNNKVKISGIADNLIKVIESSRTQLKAQVSSLSALPKLADLTTDIYIKGSGLYSTVYNIPDAGQSCSDFRTQVLTNAASMSQYIQFDGIYGEPDVQNQYGDVYGLYFRGFLKAPVTGNYKFYISSDDCSSFYIQSSQPLKTISSSTMSAQVAQWGSYRNYWENALDNKDSVTSISQNIALTADQYYFIEVFHVNAGGLGHLTLSMEVENAGSKKANSLTPMYTITTAYTAINEVIEFSLYNSDSNTQLTGNYKLQFTYGTKTIPQSGVYYLKTTDSISATESTGYMEYYFALIGYSVSVTRTKVDNSGTTLTDSASQFAGYKYTITFKSHRGTTEYRALPTIVESTLSGGTVVQNIERTQEPCDPISGTFTITMTVNGVDNLFLNDNGQPELPFDISNSKIADNVQQFTGVKPLVWSQGEPKDGKKWYIKMMQDFAGTFTATPDHLTTGNGAAAATITKSTDSNNLLFEPIPNELLFTYGTKPYVQVLTNDILSGCLGDCDLTLNENMTPTLKSFSVTNNILSLTLQAGSELSTFKASDLQIQFAGAECTYIQITNAASPFIVTCKLEQLNGQNIQLAGADQKPIVHLNQIGFVLIDASVTGTNVDLVILQITPDSGTPDGGTPVIITGTGFPKSLDSTFTLTIGGTAITPTEVTNQQIKFITPAQSDGAIQLTFNGKTATTSFTYDESKRLQVTSLEATTKSPIYRGEFTINGANFGTVVDDVKVTLVGDTKQYNAKVISVTDNSVKVYLRGGMPGSYHIIVTRKDWGSSSSTGDANLFKYIIPVSSVTLADGTSQAKGSEAGGQIILIKGSNFIISDTIVFIGNAINWICEIDESRSSDVEIYCTVPAKHPTYSVPQMVVVTLDITLESTCVAASEDACKFTYDSTLTPVITYPADTSNYSGSRVLTEEDNQKPDYLKYVTRKRYLWTDDSKQKGINHIFNLGRSQRRDMLASDDLIVSKQKVYIPDATETLSGTGLTSTINIIFKGPINKSVVATITDSSFTYTIPPLPQGFYTTYIQTENGFGDKLWITVIELGITSIDDAVNGGQILNINGHGFNQQAMIKVGDTLCTEINVVSSILIKCRMQQQQADGTQQVQISQLPSDSNSAQALIATFQLNIISTSPTINTIIFNGNNAYDATKKANLINSGDITVVISGTLFTGTLYQVTAEYQTHKITAAVSQSSTTSVTATFTKLPVGNYNLFLQIDDKYAFISDQTKIKLIVSASSPTSNNPAISYAGGATLTFTGTGFDTEVKQNQVRVCGFNCPIISATYNSLSCETPKLLTTSVLTQYSALQEPPYYIQDADLTSDSLLNTYFFDHQQSTYYVSQAASNCFVQFGFGNERALKLHQLRYVPRIDVQAAYLKGAIFQYTTDLVNWVNLLTIDQTVHTGWNIFAPTADISNIKAFRLFDSLGRSGSSCQIAEIEIKGWILSNTANTYQTPTQCSAQITVNGQQFNSISNAASYNVNSVPIVNAVTPQSGRFTEEAVITITGTGFVADQTTVTIDGVVCTIQSVTATQIVCKSGIKDLEQTQLNGVFQVRVNGNLAINNQKFVYATKWSDINTWGGYEYPGDGDSVIVNMGQTLIVDVKTPKLMQILVEGTLTFSDEMDTSLDAHYIIIREGKFNIGTELIAHQHNVQITLHGYESDVQMPAMGNKVLGCHQCELIIHGKERTPTWTLLSSTVNDGASQITVDDAVDWQIGEQIMITSSEYDHNQSEQRFIQSVSADKKTLTLDQPLKYKHYSAVETYGTDQFAMKVEVGLLSRNIVIQGEQSDVKYGYHLMIHGRAEKGAKGKIQYAEFRYGGQAKIIGRYPIHFHLNGEVDESYVIGNSIHDCYARCLTIHGVHFLKVQKNVCFNTFGHAIFFEDGIETNNVLEDNLVTSTRQSWIMLQTDITVATYWVTNPQNILRRNRSGGSEWYGFWYEIKVNPDGPSATSDICPPGLNILEFSNNYAHSNGRFGLRILQVAPRQYPCKPYGNWANDQPYLDNPSMQAVFQKFYTWKNKECGILGEELGNVLFKDIMIADSELAGFQAHKANYSAEGATLDNALIVGKSNGNPIPKTQRGLIVPRTNGFLAQNVRLYNFGGDSALIESCSQCIDGMLSVQGGKNTHFQNIQVFNSPNAKKIFWQQHRREIFWDLDGVFTSVTGGAYIVPNKKHLDGIDGCVTHSEALWDNSMICAMNKVTIRDVLINNPMPSDDFKGGDIKIIRLDSTNQAINIEQTNYETEEMKLLMIADGAASYASVFATGYMYNIQFGDGTKDPESFGIFDSPYFSTTDKAIILRFNYATFRETFDIFRNIGGKFPLTYTEQTAIPDVNSCNQGDWYNDKTNKLFFICLSGKNKKKYEYVEVRGILCRKNCDNIGEVPQEDGFRYWSDAATWANKQVPVKGDSPIIAAGYQVILDCDTPELGTLTVLGTLIFDDKRESTLLQAKKIWVRAGKILAGTSTTPFPGKIEIKLLSDTTTPTSIQTSKKVLAVSKGIELYSKIPGTVWTRLTVYADTGATQITVQSCVDWKVGDQIVIGPTFSDPDQAEARIITAVTDCQLTLDGALKFDHFGDSGVTVDKADIQKLDMRAVVGHLTRNIVISGSSDDDEGCRVVVYQFEEQPSLGFPRRGYAQLHGVEFKNCGPKDKSQSGLEFQGLNSAIIKTPSEVSGCSFHDGKGILMSAINSQYITITNNIYYNGYRALAQINNNQYVKFNNNAMIYVKKGVNNPNEKNNWAVLGNFIYMNEIVPTEMTTDLVEITGNVGQGSQDTGFFMTASKCSDAAVSTFKDNHCSTVVQACFAIRQDPQAKCSYISGLNAHNSEVGIMFAAITNQIQIDKAILVENDRGMALKQASSIIDDNQMKLSNMFISALARPKCTKCYANSKCSNLVGIQMGITGTSAFPPISDEGSSGLDLMCTTQRVDLRVYINKIEFDNFRLTYAYHSTCGNNAVFRQHGAATENTGLHYLVDSPCTNCEFDALLYKLRNPDYGRIGWFGGCGSFECTGQINILVEDQTGTFFGEIGQAIGNNTYFGPNATYCKRQDSWNGYWCPGRKVSGLMFMSTAPDYNKRLYSPVSLTDGEFYNQINSYFEWGWAGGEPLNTRESKFIGIITVNSVINMTNAGTNPTSSEYWISKRKEQGSPEDFVIIQLQFQVSQIIQVLVNNKVILPGLTTNSKHHDLTTMTDQCGANNYFFENRTIHFVLTGQIGCKVKITLKNTLQVSTRLEITEDQFFGDKFIQYARAQLGGDPYNYFIIGTKKASRRFLQSSSVQAVEVNWGIADSAEIGTDDSKQSSTRLASLAAQLEALPLNEDLKSLGVVGIKTQSSTIAAISELNFSSSEQTKKSGASTGGNTGGSTGGNTGGSNTGGSTGGNTGGNTSGNTGTNDDKIIFSPDESVNEDNNNEQNNTDTPIQPNETSSSDDDHTVTIVLAVILPIVGISLIVVGILYFKKRTNIITRVQADQSQKMDNEYFQNEIASQQQIVESPQG